VVYRDAVAGELDYWKCADRKEFEDTFLSHYGQRLALADLPAGIQAPGLAYVNSISTRTICMLGRTPQGPVIVLIDRAEQDRGATVSPESGLHVHRRRVGTLVLLEVSPFEHPALLEYLELPEGDGAS
jgi:hypothetical protein